jgi:hypothetical protein
MYHYTGIGSVLCIVKNECVYASHTYYLNGSQEMLYGYGNGNGNGNGRFSFSLLISTFEVAPLMVDVCLLMRRNGLRVQLCTKQPDLG